MVGRLAGGQDALVYRIDRSGQVRWSLSQVAGVQKAEEAVSPAGESIDLVGLEQTEVVLLAPDEIGPGRGYKVKGKRLSSGKALL